MKKVIVVGGLNTDIIANGVDTLLGPGELTRSGKLVVGPGGKSRNIAQMIAAYEKSLAVHMIGKTARDPYGLWEPPYRSLQEAGVNVDSVEIFEGGPDGPMPGIALIPVDKKGRNQIYVLPGINDSLGRLDIEKNLALFRETGKTGGVLAISLEIPLDGAVSSLKAAGEQGVRSVVDPGGISPHENFDSILTQDIFLLKPNEHEIEILSGIKVSDGESASRAARSLMDKYPVKNILITLGSRGSYLVSRDFCDYYPLFEIKELEDSDCDETGCGDQVTAVMAAEICLETGLKEAVSRAMVAGSLQFYRTGVQAVTGEDVSKVSKKAVKNDNR